LLFQKNVQILKKIEPYLVAKLKKVKPNKEGPLPYLSQKLDLVIDDDLKFHDVIVILGFGLGDHIRKVISSSSKSSLILIIDHDLSTFKALLESIDLSDIFSHQQVSLSFDEDLLLATRGRIEQYFGEVMLAETFKIIKNPISMNLAPDFYEKVLNQLNEIQYIAYLNLGSILRSNYISEINTIKNLPAIVCHPGVGELSNKFRNVPAIIVSSGPSLSKNVSFIRHAKNKAIIICVDTALKVLQRHQIEPDFVTSIEFNLKNYLCFKKIKLRNTYLIASEEVAPKTINKFKEKVFFIHSSNPITKWFSKVINLKESISLGGNVGATSFSLAINLGANPIIFVGQDLSYSQGKYYADEIDSSFIEAKKDDAKKRKTVWLESIYGEKVASDSGMLVYLRWFEREIACHQDRIFINATEGGAKIKGTEPMVLQAVIDAYCQNNLNITDIINETFKKPDQDIEKVILSIKTLLEEYQTILIYSSQGKELIKRHKSNKSKDKSKDISRNHQVHLSLSMIVKDIISLPNFMEANKLSIESLLHRLKKGRKSEVLNNYLLFFKEITKFSRQLLISFEKILPKLESLIN